VDVRALIAEKAEEIRRGRQARDELHQLIRENNGVIGPTEIAELTDGLYRPEHISRIAHSKPAPPARLGRPRRKTGPADSG
jgi:hypothetical protein